jgi:hypothetical protein
MPKNQPSPEEFGTELSPPDNIPLGTQGMIRPTVNAQAGGNVSKNIQRRIKRLSRVTANPYAIDDQKTHAGLIGD